MYKLKKLILLTALLLVTGKIFAVTDEDCEARYDSAGAPFHTAIGSLSDLPGDGGVNVETIDFNI